jgi:two-component system LytT family response regulator
VVRTRLSAVIIDDERLARNEMRSLLGKYPEIEVIGEAADVSSGVLVLENNQPDLLFLDIKLGNESGFELLDRIRRRPRVVFVTAYDEYAVRAFEVNAMDYLLKPVNPNRLKKTIARLVKKAPKRKASRTLDYKDRIFLQIDDKTQFLKVSDIRTIQAAGDYSQLHFGAAKHGLVLKPLIHWEKRLPEKYFVRIHRGTIVNLEYVTKIEKWFHRSYRVHVEGISEPKILSRRRANELKNKMS